MRVKGFLESGVKLIFSLPTPFPTRKAKAPITSAEAGARLEQGKADIEKFAGSYT